MNHMSLDQVLLATSIGSYSLAAIALFAYFLSREAWLRNFGAPLAILGCVVQFTQLVVRFETTGIWPLLNLYGSLSLFAAMAVAIYVGFAFKYKLWFAGGFVLAVAAIALAYGATWNEGHMPPVPSLQSYWAKIHVPIVVSSYSAFLVSFVVSCIYLLKYYAEKSFEGKSVAGAMATDAGSAMLSSAVLRQPFLAVELESRGVDIDFSEDIRHDTPAIAAAAAAGNPVAQWLAALPSLGQLDVIVYRAVAVGLPLISIGIITGAMWAKESWGAYWQWDPKETAALLTWIIYLAYMHLHTRHAWRGMRTNWVSVIGFVSVIFCYLGVNIFISGLHSYKM
jgi:cytochrome c-type biogenesis protein CcsB